MSNHYIQYNTILQYSLVMLVKHYLITPEQHINIINYHETQ